MLLKGPSRQGFLSLHTLSQAVGNVLSIPLSIPLLKCPGYFRTGVDPDRKSLPSRLPDALALPWLLPQAGTGRLAQKKTQSPLAP